VYTLIFVKYQQVCIYKVVIDNRSVIVMVSNPKKGRMAPLLRLEKKREKEKRNRELPL
jgi:hypothetical protein